MGHFKIARWASKWNIFHLQVYIFFLKDRVEYEFKQRETILI